MMGTRGILSEVMALGNKANTIKLQTSQMKIGEDSPLDSAEKQIIF